MAVCGLIRIGAVAAGLAAVPIFAQSGHSTNSEASATEQASDFDEGGRRVSLKPINDVGFGSPGSGETGWVIGGGLAAICLLFGSGALVTAKLRPGRSL